MLNASVGVQRVLGRVRRPPDHQATSVTPREARSLAAAHKVRHGLHTVVAASRLVPVRDYRPPATVRVAGTGKKGRRTLISRIGPDRAVAIAVVGILVSASAVSISAGQPAPATGGPTGNGPAPRIVVGGGVGAVLGEKHASGEPDTTAGTGSVAFADPAPATSGESRLAAVDFDRLIIPASGPVTVEGPFIDDGTLVKPIAVDTRVPDGSALVRTYKVKSGDSLAAIARKFGVSTMTVFWANDLKSKDDLKKGKVLRIPPVTGLIVRIAATDTLDSLATRYGVASTDILATNGLEDPNLVVGQVLVVPGAKGKAIPKPKPVVTKPTSRVTPKSTGGSRSISIREPATYSGGKFAWPVAGGGNYVSQYYRYGHYGLDIAGDYGSTVRAGGAGTVIFAGWKSNGGGYQVWIAHGSGLFTTYNHMSSVSVGRGQEVGRGAQVGRVGSSGNATGPHLHFEVWRGAIWDGGQRVNPLGYL